MAITIGVVFLLFLALAVTVGTTIRKWGSFTSREHLTYIVLIGWQILMIALLAYIAWPLSSFGLSQRNEIANEFMSSLNSGKNEVALEIITSTSAEEYSAIFQDVSDPNNKPVSWDLQAPNSNNIVLGEAVFPDGEVLDVALFLEWEWEEARWGISGVEFGRDLSEARIRFWLYDTFLPYAWFRMGVIVVGIICIIFSVLMVRNSYKSPAHAESFA